MEKTTSTTERLASQLHRTSAALAERGHDLRATRTAGFARTLDSAADGDALSASLARQLLPEPASASRPCPDGWLTNGRRVHAGSFNGTDRVCETCGGRG